MTTEGGVKLVDFGKCGLKCVSLGCKMNSYDNSLVIFCQPHFLSIESGEKMVSHWAKKVQRFFFFFVSLVSERFPEERMTLFKPLSLCVSHDCSRMCGWCLKIDGTQMITLSLRGGPLALISCFTNGHVPKCSILSREGKPSKVSGKIVSVLRRRWREVVFFFLSYCHTWTCCSHVAPPSWCAPSRVRTTLREPELRGRKKTVLDGRIELLNQWILAPAPSLDLLSCEIINFPIC